MLYLLVSTALARRGLERVLAMTGPSWLWSMANGLTRAKSFGGKVCCLLYWDRLVLCFNDSTNGHE